MDNPALVEVTQTCGGFLELSKEQNQHRLGNSRRLSYQTVPICLILPNILLDTPIDHHFRNHRALAVERIDVDGDEF